MVPVVYRVTNVNSGRYYLGSSKDFVKRVEAHMAQFKSGTHHNKTMQTDYDKGDEFTFVTVFILETREEAFEYEQTMLNENRNDPLMYNIGRSSKGGDNLTDNPRRDDIVKAISKTLRENYAKMTPEERKTKHGLSGIANGMYGKTHTPEVIAHLSKINLGKVRSVGYRHTDGTRKLLSKISKLRIGDKNPFFGKTHSEETRNKIRQCRLGTLPSNAQTVSINGVTYRSCNEASKALGIPAMTIRWRVKNEKPKYAEWKFA